MNDSAKPTKTSRPTWLRKAFGAIVDLPTRHRPVAFVAALLAGLAVTFAATLLTKSGFDFLAGTPVIAFVAFMIGTLALLFYLKPGASVGLVGLFYFLPFLYAVVVLVLAFFNLSTGGGNLSLTTPVDRQAIFSPFSVDWDPPYPALVSVSHNGNVVGSSNDFVQPPFSVDASAGEGYLLKITTRSGQTATARLSVIEDPRKASLESVYRPGGQHEAGHIQVGLIIPLGYAIDAVVEVAGDSTEVVRVFGQADTCGSGIKRPYGSPELCFYDLPDLLLPATGVLTATLDGRVLDRAGRIYNVRHSRSVRFGGELVSLHLEVKYDGRAALVEVPG